MPAIHAASALLPGGWAADVRISVSGGRVAAIERGVAARPGDERHELLVAGMPDLHSHAFQRAMAGLAEVRGPGSDSFWSWREAMYGLALRMTPDQLQAVAAWLYAEMLEAGFTRVGEFHYLHHAPDGTRYGDIGEMAAQIAAAAGTTGIGLTLLPVLYSHSGFGGQAPNSGQRRFVSGIDDYARLFERCEAIVSRLPGAGLGVAPHSLRAVAPEALSQAVAIAGRRPVHIHIAEQTAEVEDCVAFCGRRPVEWLMENLPVDGRWCLIHATHMNEGEIRAVAGSGAVVGLCPVTEANLGDGIFPGSAFLAGGGRFGIGSDSNVRVGVADELRQLEYSQRLAERRRNVLARPGTSTGRSLFEQAVAGGAVALQAEAGIAEGSPADFVGLVRLLDHPAGPDRSLDQWIFARGVAVDAVWVRGRKLVAGGAHIKRDALRESFLQAMRQILF